MTLQRKATGKKIGFGEFERDAKAYDREITTEDLIAHGVLPELIGRISRVVNLTLMTEADYYEMLGAECSPTTRLEKQYGVSITLSPETWQTLAETAAQSGLGVRAVESMLRRKLDEALFEDCSQSSFEF